jgi:magnesium transporter
VTLRATLYDAPGTDQTVELTEGIASKLGKRQLLWVDLEGRDQQLIDRIGKVLDLPEDAVHHLSQQPSTARLLRYEGMVHLRVVALQPAEANSGRSIGPGGASIEVAPIDIVGAANLVVTIHDQRVRAFDAFVEEVRGDSHLGELDAAGFIGALVDSVLTIWLEIVEAIERRIDALDELALRGGRPESFLSEVVALRRRIAEMRRTLAPHRTAFAPLARPDFEVPELGRPWPGLVERLERTIDATQSARDLLLGSFDVYMARAAHRTNNVMKVLTVLNAVLLPAIVLAGVMGMNFKIAFFEEPGNFWLAVSAMIALATTIIGVSRWRGWI